MRHAKFGRKLGRDTNARKALLANLASSLVTNGAVTTTLAKAKFAQGFIEKLVTDAKEDALPRQRRLASILSRQALIKLTRDIAVGNAKRIGGYTRIIKLGTRRGDAAPLARLEFLEWGEPATSQKLSRRTSAKSGVARKPATQKVQKGKKRTQKR